MIGTADEIASLTGALGDQLDGVCHLNVQTDTYYPEQVWIEVTAARATKAAATTAIGSNEADGVANWLRDNQSRLLPASQLASGRAPLDQTPAHVDRLETVLHQ